MYKNRSTEQRIHTPNCNPNTQSSYQLRSITSSVTANSTTTSPMLETRSVVDLHMCAIRLQIQSRISLSFISSVCDATWLCALTCTITISKWCVYVECSGVHVCLFMKMHVARVNSFYATATLRYRNKLIVYNYIGSDGVRAVRTVAAAATPLPLCLFAAHTAYTNDSHFRCVANCSTHLYDCVCI